MHVTWLLRLSKMGHLFLTDGDMASWFMASSSWSSFAALLPRFGLSGRVPIQVGGLGGGVFSTSMSTGGYSNGRYIFGIGRLLGTWADHVLMAMASEELSGGTLLGSFSCTILWILHWCTSTHCNSSEFVSVLSLNVQLDIVGFLCLQVHLARQL